MSISYSNFYFSRDPDSIPVEPGNMILDKDNDVLVIDDDVNHRHYIGNGGGGGGGGDSDLFTERRNILNIDEYPGEVIDTKEILYNSVGFCSCWDIDTLGIGTDSNGENCWRAVFNPYNTLAAGAINNSIVTQTNIPAYGIHNSAVFNAGYVTGTDGIYNSLIFGQAADSSDGSSRPFVLGSIGITRSVIFAPYESNLHSNYSFDSSDVFLCSTNGLSSNMDFNHTRACFIDVRGLGASNIGGSLSDVTLLGSNISNCSPCMSRFFGVWSNINIQDTGGPLYSDIFVHGGNFTTIGTGPFYSSIKSIGSNISVQTPYQDNITYIGSNIMGAYTHYNPLVNLTRSNGNGSSIEASVIALCDGNFTSAYLYDSIILGSRIDFINTHLSKGRIFGSDLTFSNCNLDYANIFGYYTKSVQKKNFAATTIFGYNCNMTSNATNSFVVGSFSNVGNITNSYIFTANSNIDSSNYSIIGGDSLKVIRSHSSVILGQQNNIDSNSSTIEIQNNHIIGANNVVKGANYTNIFGENWSVGGGLNNTLIGGSQLGSAKIDSSNNSMVFAFGSVTNYTLAGCQNTLAFGRGGYLGGCIDSFIYTGDEKAASYLSTTNSILLMQHFGTCSSLGGVSNSIVMSVTDTHASGANYSVAIGNYLNIDGGTRSFVAGYNVSTGGSSNSFVGGYNINAGGLSDSVVIGTNINSYGGPNTIMLGNNLSVNSPSKVVYGNNIQAASGSYSTFIGTNIGSTNANLAKSVIIGLDHHPAETIEKDGQTVTFLQPQVLIGGSTRPNTTDRVALAESRLPESGTSTVLPHEILRYTLEEEMILDSNGDITFNYNGNSTNISTLVAGVAQIGNINTILTSIVGE